MISRRTGGGVRENVGTEIGSPVVTSAKPLLDFLVGQLEIELTHNHISGSITLWCEQTHLEIGPTPIDYASAPPFMIASKLVGLELRVDLVLDEQGKTTAAILAREHENNV